MITREFAEACTEINEIFKLLNETELNKIPYELREVFNKAQARDYTPHIDYAKTLDKQELKKKTKDILVTLYVKYWCKEDKEEINKILNENYEKKQLELLKKYNPDDIFKNKVKNYNKENNLTLIHYKESIFTKIINKIRNLFKE